MYFSNKYKIIVSLISLIILITSIQDTYGKYKSEATGTTNISIARWNIKVNSQDIISDNQITNTLTPYFIGNANIADDVIAPSAVGYFDINIDCTEIDVSFIYSITTTVDETSDVDDLIVTGYSIDGGSIVPVAGSLTDLNETILFDATEKTRNYRIYIKWDDEVTATMDNSSDTLAALANGSAKINVALNFQQITE